MALSFPDFQGIPTIENMMNAFSVMSTWSRNGMRNGAGRAKYLLLGSLHAYNGLFYHSLCHFACMYLNNVFFKMDCVGTLSLYVKIGIYFCLVFSVENGYTHLELLSGGMERKQIEGLLSHLCFVGTRSCGKEKKILFEKIHNCN